MLHGHNAMQTSPDSPHILKIHRFPTCSSHIFGLHMSSPSSPPWEYLKISKVLRWFRSAVMMLSAWASHCDVARIAKVERRKDGWRRSTGGCFWCKGQRLSHQQWRICESGSSPRLVKTCLKLVNMTSCINMVVLRRAPSKKLNLQAGAKIQLVPDQWVACGSRCTPMCVGASVEKTAHYVCQPLCRWRRCCLRFWPLSLFHQRRRELQSCRAMAPFWTFYICAICHCFVLMKMARANQHLSSHRTVLVMPHNAAWSDSCHSLTGKLVYNKQRYIARKNAQMKYHPTKARQRGWSRRAQAQPIGTTNDNIWGPCSSSSSNQDAFLKACIAAQASFEAAFNSKWLQHATCDQTTLPCQPTGRRWIWRLAFYAHLQHFQCSAQPSSRFNAKTNQTTQPRGACVQNNCSNS